MANQRDDLFIDLQNIDADDVEVLAQEGSRGMPEFAASTASCGTCNEGGCSCTVENQDG